MQIFGKPDRRETELSQLDHMSTTSSVGVKRLPLRFSSVNLNRCQDLKFKSLYLQKVTP
jgi:hypothetical protein